jgi:hypothetical protein
VQSAFGYLGVVLFQSCMRKWTFRAVLSVTVVLEVAAGAVDLVIVQRWNVKYLGIPDEVMCASEGARARARARARA